MYSESAFTGRVWDFHPLDCAHAWRTIKRLNESSFRRLLPSLLAVFRTPPTRQSPKRKIFVLSFFRFFVFRFLSFVFRFCLFGSPAPSEPGAPAIRRTGEGKDGSQKPPKRRGFAKHTARLRSSLIQTERISCRSPLKAAESLLIFPLLFHRNSHAHHPYHCRYWNFTNSAQKEPFCVRGLYRRLGISPDPEDFLISSYHKDCRNARGFLIPLFLGGSCPLLPIRRKGLTPGSRPNPPKG